MHDAASDLPAYHDRIFERVDRELGLAPRRHGLADDPIGEHICDGAQVQDAFTGCVLRDVGEPQVVGTIRVELVAHSAMLVNERTQVIVDRGAWAGVLGKIGRAHV